MFIGLLACGLPNLSTCWSR